MTVESVETPPALSFESMKLSEPIRRALIDVGYAAPTSVQAAVWEPICAGTDVIVQSKTGSGKTAAFALPLLDRVVQPERRVQAMVLCPTRELALQVAGEIARLGKYKGISTTAIYGGASMVKQIDELNAGAQIVAGTPGRVLDHLRRGTLDVKGLRAICLDEADEMLSMGFAEELNAILEFIPKKRQGLLFSATMPEQIQRLARRHLTAPQFITLSTDNVAPTDITHYVFFVGLGSRTRELARILEIEKPEGTLIFCNTKDETSAVASELKRLGLEADFINGDLDQSSRERVLASLRTGAIKYLVATDVAARGIDVQHLTHVVNYGFPDSAEQYVHRTGRTGRAGRRGTAISLITPKDVGNLYLLRLTYGIRPIERALPSATEERTKREADRIRLLREAFTEEPSEEALLLARRLLTHDHSEKLVASLLSEFFNIATRQAIARGIGPLAPKPVAAPLAAAPAPAREARPAEPRPAPAARNVRDDRPALRPDPGARPPVAAGAPAVHDSAIRDPAARRPPPPQAPVERPRRIDVHGAGTFEDDSPEIGMEEIRLAIGRRDGVRAGDIARVVREKANLQRRDVGRIYVRDRFSLVSVRAEMLDATLEALKDVQMGDRPLAPEKGKGLNPSLPPPAPTISGDDTVVVPPAARAPEAGKSDE